MLAIRDKKKIKNNKIAIKLPDGHNEKEVEIIVLIPDKSEGQHDKDDELDPSIIYPSALKKNSRLPGVIVKGKPLSQKVIEDRQ